MKFPTPTQPRPNLSVYLSQQVLALIREQELKPGDRLPPAKALADQFAVATPTMREALRRLQATGVIDIRHGSGIYVMRDSDRLMLANPAYGELEHHTILQVLDARVLIEPHLAELAALHASKSDLSTLQKLIDDAERALIHHDDAYIEVNHALHVAIARASGNAVLSNVVESLLEMYSTELHIVDPNSTLADIRTRDQRHHVQVVTAIAAGDGRAASKAMAEHIEVARGTVVFRVSS